MSIISKEISRLSFLVLLSFLFVACGFDGPWSFYPEERDIYAGIYTYGYIVEGENPYVCFSKMYQLDESSAEDFAFYDSAYVAVSGVFDDGSGSFEKKKIVLRADVGKPKCFSVPENEYSKGVAGETYTLNAVFRWDSVGHDVKSTFSAKATIPEGFGLRGVNLPLKGGEYEWHDIDVTKYENTFFDERFEVDFLEYPDDINVYKFVIDYNETVGGVMLVLDYDVKDGGENMNTTINHMLGGMLDTDSSGYTGVSIHDALEGQLNMGYEENRVVAGINMLDTLYIPNLNLSLGRLTFHFFATDEAYYLYHRYVMGSIDDSRVIPKSNIENGMGVFSGMSHVSLPLLVKGTGVSYSHIAITNCVNGSSFDSDGWDTKSCRLYQDVFCSGAYRTFEGKSDELYELNRMAYTFYRKGDVAEVENEFCYAPAIKAAMMLDTTSWSLFLPKNITQAEKKEAYGDALKRYCVASNFKSNKIADCSVMEESCLESLEKTDCKIYLWEWCADRNWDFDEYPQCISGFVSRYYLEELKSNILEREVDNICNHGTVGVEIKQCKRK